MPGSSRKSVTALVAVLVGIAGLSFILAKAGAPTAAAEPAAGGVLVAFTSDGKLKQPAGYRNWIRGCNSDFTCACFHNLTYPLNSNPFAGSTLFMDISMGSQHPGGANFGFADGTVRFVQNSVDFNVYQWTGTRMGGETRSVD